MKLSYTLTDQASEEVRKQIVAPLIEYNERKAGPQHYRPLVVELRDEAGAIVGGLWGGTGFGWLFTQLLVVPETARGRGVGARLLELAELEAIARGCHCAWLDTFEFQARGFYEKRGYASFGVLADYPTGFSRFFLHKHLVEPARKGPSG